MSEVWGQRSSARRSFEASRQSVGFLSRRLVAFVALERQPQGRGSVCSVCDGLPTTDASVASGLGTSHLVCIADSARTLGRVVRSWRMMMHVDTPNPKGSFERSAPRTLSTTRTSSRGASKLLLVERARWSYQTLPLPCNFLLPPEGRPVLIASDAVRHASQLSLHFTRRRGPRAGHPPCRSHGRTALARRSGWTDNTGPLAPEEFVGAATTGQG